MNILPMIFAFLLIFSLLSASFFREARSQVLFEKVLEAYARTERMVSNAIIAKTYRKLKGEPLAKKDGQQSPKKDPKYTSKRAVFPPIEESKFNIAPLLKHTGELHLHPLYEPLADLVRLLYQERVFSKVSNREKIEYRLLNAMLKKGRNNPGVENLTDLFPEDPSLKKIYYKILKGTNHYASDAGIAPLHHFLSLQKADTAVNLCYASEPVLASIFGPKMAQQVLDLEEAHWQETKKYAFVTKDELQNMLMQIPTLASKYTPLETYVDFSKIRSPNRQIAGRDKDTGIAVERTL